MQEIIQANVELVEENAAPRVDPQQSADALQKFWEDLDVFPSTMNTYKRNMSRFVSWLEGQGMTVLDARFDTLKAYKKHLETIRKQSSTIQTYLIPVKRFYRWLSEAYGTPNFSSMLKAPRVGRASSKDALSPQQAWKCVEVARNRSQDGFSGLRDYAIFMLLIGCGLRTVEVSRLDAGDLRQTADGATVLLIHGKGHAKKDEEQTIPDVVRDVLFQYMDARGAVRDDAPMFTGLGNRSKGERLSTRSISKIAKEIMTAAGVVGDQYTAHSLRHTAVTQALNSGATVQEVQRLARHSNIQTTMRYAHNLDAHHNPAVEGAVSYLKAFACA